MSAPKPKHTIRASALPRFVECASSEVETDAPYNPRSDVAALGTASHEGMDEIVHSRPVEVAELAAKHRISDKELGIMLAYGRRVWKELSKYFPNPETNVRVDSDLVRGYADLLHHDGKTAVIVDWKSGRVQSSGTYQVMGYAHALVEKLGFPKSGKITTIVVWLRFGEYDVYQMDAQALADFEATVRRRMRDIGRQYAPGEHCGFCPRMLECDARRDYIRSSVASLEEIDFDDVAPETLGAAYTRVKMVKQAIEAYYDALRMVIQEEGPLLIGNDRVIKLGQQTRYKIDPKKAWPVLQASGFSNEEINGTLTMSKGKVQDVAAERASHGGKGRARQEILEALEEADAAHPYTQDRLTVAKQPAPKPKAAPRPKTAWDRITDGGPA